MSNPNIGQYAHLGGAPKGNQHALKHGLVAIRAQVRRRVKHSRDRIDKRTAEGKEALDLRGRYIEDLGGLDQLSTGEFMGIVGLSETWWLRAMQLNAIKKYLIKNPRIAENPKAISQLYQYVAPVDEKVIRYMQLLGLEKRAPRPKSLEEILSESEESDGGVTP